MKKFFVVTNLFLLFFINPLQAYSYSNSKDNVIRLACGSGYVAGGLGSHYLFGQGLGFLSEQLADTNFLKGPLKSSSETLSTPLGFGLSFLISQLLPLAFTAKLHIDQSAENPSWFQGFETIIFRDLSHILTNPVGSLLFYTFPALALGDNVCEELYEQWDWFDSWYNP